MLGTWHTNGRHANERQNIACPHCFQAYFVSYSCASFFIAGIWHTNGGHANERQKPARPHYFQDCFIYIRVPNIRVPFFL